MLEFFFKHDFFFQENSKSGIVRLKVEEGLVMYSIATQDFVPWKDMVPQDFFFFIRKPERRLCAK
jgi:hypothetical protein